MGNGVAAEVDKLASVTLAETGRGAARAGLPLRVESLTISDLFPGQTVNFPFSDLPGDGRRELSACFPGQGY